MKMTFRWYGSKTDPIPLKYVKQIPGMTGLMGLLEKPAGVDWPEEEFAALKKEVNDAGLEIEVSREQGITIGKEECICKLSAKKAESAAGS